MANIKCGIYKLENLINHKVYIGQSVNIDRRTQEHKTKKQQQIDQAIQKYGFDNFSLEILEECDPTELDELEQYYIVKYNSLVPNGYNLTPFAHGSNYGELNPACKISNEEIRQIRQYYKNKTYPSARNMWLDKFSQYSEYYIICIFYGNYRNDIDMEVYEDMSLREYYKKSCRSNVLRGKDCIFTTTEEQDVIHMRILYTTVDKYEVIKRYPQYEERTIVSILMGQNWKQFPIYRKKAYKDRPKGWEYPKEWTEEQIDNFKKEFLNG